MRIIKFRGKRVDNGEWVYGFLSEYQSKTIISSEIIENPSYSDPAGSWSYLSNEVIPETVGQFTGLTDRNGVEIYEGDILKYAKDEAYEVVYDDKEAHYAIMGIFSETYNSALNIRKASYFDVIGNIHDNPELMKGE